MNSQADLWTYSLRVYGHDDVAVACLWLQNRHAVNVNLLLYGCWLGAQGLELDADTLAAARRAVGPWTTEVVEPLRHARSWMKAQLATVGAGLQSDCAALRERIKTAELEAEHCEQRMLEQLPAPARASGPHGGDSVRVSADNSVRYLRSIGVTPDSDVADRLGVVVARASGASGATARHAVDEAVRATGERQ